MRPTQGPSVGIRPLSQQNPPLEADALEFTGERFTPECVREIWYEHLHRYVLAAPWTAGKNVLDAACGEGYGSACLAAHAATVTGVDISSEAIAHAQSRYPASNLEFVTADCRELPFEDGQFDVIVSFETLEHMREQEQLLGEFRRVLAEDGLLLISSPDKAVYSDALQHDNPYHLRELYRHELDALLATQFPAVRMLGQKLAFHSMIWPVDEDVPGAANARRHQASLVRHARPGTGQEQNAPAAVYLIAACAANQACLPDISDGLWLFEDVEESVYRHYQHEIRKNMQAGAILQEKDREIAELKARLQAAQGGEPTGWWRRLLGRR